MTNPADVAAATLAVLDAAERQHADDIAFAERGRIDAVVDALAALPALIALAREDVTSYRDGWQNEYDAGGMSGYPWRAHYADRLRLVARHIASAFPDLPETARLREAQHD